jgi:hypothetical protein
VLDADRNSSKTSHHLDQQPCSVGEVDTGMVQITSQIGPVVLAIQRE